MIEIPRFLKPKQLESLNDLLVAKAGCFAFLGIEMPIDVHPSTYKEALHIYVMKLYVLYNDYGCRFLEYFLPDAGQAPNLSPIERTEAQMRGINADIRRSREHVRTIKHILRMNICHGILEDRLREQFVDTVKEYGNLHAEKRDDGWLSYINGLTDEQWKPMVERVVSEADRLYRYLEQWANDWGQAPEEAMRDNRLHFGQSEQFRKSFDMRICSEILKSCGEQKQSTISRLTNSGNPNAHIHAWRNDVVTEYCSGRLNTPQEVYARLCYNIKKEVTPPTVSSLDVADCYGFGC